MVQESVLLMHVTIKHNRPEEMWLITVFISPDEWKNIIFVI